MFQVVLMAVCLLVPVSCGERTCEDIRANIADLSLQQFSGMDLDELGIRMGELQKELTEKGCTP